MDISSLLEVEVNEGKPSDLSNNGEIAAYKNIPDFSIRDIASVRFRKLHCTACDLHIGSAPAEAHNMHEHPVLHVLLCTNCRNFYGDGTFEQGDDATDMFCRWCANGGNLYCCSYCSNTFCYNCIKRNFDPMIRKKIERDEKWKCFACNPADLYSARAACWALLQHVQTVTRILQSDRKMSPKEIEAKMNLDESQCCPHKKKRKRSETMSDDEEEDETYGLPKKRRKVLSSKRKKRVYKLEMPDPPVDGSIVKSSNNQRNTDSSRVAMRELEDVYLAEPRQKRSQLRHSNNDRHGKLQSDDLPLAVRKSNRRSHDETINMANFSLHDDDIPAPLLQCDQSMIEGAESLTFPITNVPSVREGNSLMLDQVQQSGGIGISPVPTMNLLKRVNLSSGPLTRGGKTHRLVRGIGGGPILVRKIAPAINANSATSSIQSMPMVTIPSRNHTQQSTNRSSAIQPTTNETIGNSLNSNTSILRPVRSRVTIGKPAATTKVRLKAPPSVIDLDSDSDEPIVLVGSSSEMRNSVSNDRISTVTYPARPDDGLMTIITTATKNRSDNVVNDDVNSENESSENERRIILAKNFEQAIRGPTNAFDTVLDSLKNKLKKIMDSTIVATSDKELLAAKAKTRAVNRTIKRTVAELTFLNDNLVRAYHTYKRERTKEKRPHTETITLDKREKSGSVTPLDMECTRESEPECDEIISDDDDESEENLQNVAPIREIRPFRTRVHRAVEAKPETWNKSVQVDDTVLRDCESSIGYSLLLKADYDQKRQRDILRPVIVPDENFGKYEEAFISYLQHIEDHGIETVESKELAPNVSISINDLVEADIRVEANRAESVEKMNEETPVCEERIIIEEESREETMTDENVEIFEEHVEILTTKSVSSGKSDSSDLSSDDETLTSTTREKPSRDNANSDRENSGNTLEKEQTETMITTNNEKNDSTAPPTNVATSVEKETNKDESAPAIPENDTKKNDGQTVEEETVLAVRALIEENSNENGSNMDILKNWKPIDSDDECTILD